MSMLERAVGAAARPAAGSDRGCDQRRVVFTRSQAPPVSPPAPEGTRSTGNTGGEWTKTTSSHYGTLPSATPALGYANQITIPVRPFSTLATPARTAAAARSGVNESGS
jgi:hypothetical protein